MGKGKWKNENSRKYRETLTSEESKIYNRPIEYGAVIDSNGNIIFEKTSDRDDYVQFTEQECQQMRGQTYTHNHPNASCLSDSDIKLMTDYGIKTFRATAGDKVYQLTEGAGEKNAAKFADDYHNYMRTTEKEMTRGARLDFMHDKISQDEFYRQMDSIEQKWWNSCSSWLRKNAKNYGYIYSIQKRG